MEWIEIYNNSFDDTNLGEYILISDSDTNFLPDGIFIGAASYVVLARQLVPDNGSDSFESYWGDSSGVWGDSDIENYVALDIDMTLSNSSGEVILSTINNVIIDQISWSTASDDGRSIERDNISDINSGWHDCFDPDGSTPGRTNSEIPQGGQESFDVSINPIVVSARKNDFADFLIDVVTPPATKLSIEIFDETGFKVKSLVDNSEINVLRIGWDGKDDKGRYLSPGIYIISFILTGGSNQTKNYPVIIAP